MGSLRYLIREFALTAIQAVVGSVWQGVDCSHRVQESSDSNGSAMINGSVRRECQASTVGYLSQDLHFNYRHCSRRSLLHPVVQSPLPQLHHEPLLIIFESLEHHNVRLNIHLSLSCWGSSRDRYVAPGYLISHGCNTVGYKVRTNADTSLASRFRRQ